MTVEAAYFFRATFARQFRLQANINLQVQVRLAMPSPPRILLPDFPVMITTRTEEGLPFVARPIMNLIVYSAIARAQHLYSVEINHLIMMGNHCHILIRVLDPDQVAAFMDYFKTETAHAINRILGRRKRTVWEDGYDSVPILTLEDTIKKIAYIYTNPQRANLVADIDSYPSVSSWVMYQSNNLSREVPWVRRNFISQIRDHGSRSEEQLLYEYLLNSAKETHTFTLSPDGWMVLFGIEDPAEKTSINQRILATVREIESELKANRERETKTVLGAERLKIQPINKPYTPKKFSKRMWCVCFDKDLRIRFIQYIKWLLAVAKEVTKMWRNGNFSERLPLGLFPPRMPRLANLRPGTIFT